MSYTGAEAFVFDDDGEFVALVVTTDGEVTGGIMAEREDGENIQDTMVRTIRAETGIETERDTWEFVGKVGEDGERCAFRAMNADLRALLPGELHESHGVMCTFFVGDIIDREVVVPEHVYDAVRAAIL